MTESDFDLIVVDLPGPQGVIGPTIADLQLPAGSVIILLTRKKELLNPLGTDRDVNREILDLAGLLALSNVASYTLPMPGNPLAKQPLCRGAALRWKELPTTLKKRMRAIGTDCTCWARNCTNG